MIKNIERGQVWFHAPTYTPSGHIQKGTRPVIIVSNNVCNKNSSVVLGVPCTTQIKKNFPTQIMFIMKKQVSIAMAEQAGPINVDELTTMEYVLEDYIMDRIDEALKVAFGLTTVPTAGRSSYGIELSTLGDSARQGAASKPPIGRQIEKFYNKYPEEKPVMAARKTNRWTPEKIKEFVYDCRNYPEEKICAKYNITKITADIYYKKFTEEVID